MCEFRKIRWLFRHRISYLCFIIVMVLAVRNIIFLASFACDAIVGYQLGIMPLVGRCRFIPNT